MADNQRRSGTAVIAIAAANAAAVMDATGHGLTATGFTTALCAGGLAVAQFRIRGDR